MLDLFFLINEGDIVCISLTEYIRSSQGKESVSSSNCSLKSRRNTGSLSAKAGTVFETGEDSL